MAHCPYEKLADLEAVLDAVRSWPAIKEKGQGIFYLKSTPFMHFHEKDGDRWADVREGKAWGEKLEIAFNSSKTKRDRFQKEVRRRYDLMVKPR